MIETNTVQQNWKQCIFWHGCTGVVEPAFWRHTSVYILKDNNTMSLLTQLSDVTSLCVENNTIFTQILENKSPFVSRHPLCVENNTIFTQMLENKRPFVLRTIQYLHKCLKTKDPLCWEQYNIDIDAWKTKDPLCHLGNEWRHIFQTFQTFHRVPKLR